MLQLRAEYSSFTVINAPLRNVILAPLIHLWCYGRPAVSLAKVMMRSPRPRSGDAVRAPKPQHPQAVHVNEAKTTDVSKRRLDHPISEDGNADRAGIVHPAPSTVAVVAGVAAARDAIRAKSMSICTTHASAFHGKYMQRCILRHTRVQKIRFCILKPWPIVTNMILQQIEWRYPHHFRDFHPGSALNSICSPTQKQTPNAEMNGDVNKHQPELPLVSQNTTAPPR